MFTNEIAGNKEIATRKSEEHHKDANIHFSYCEGYDRNTHKIELKEYTKAEFTPYKPAKM